MRCFPCAGPPVAARGCGLPRGTGERATTAGGCVTQPCPPTVSTSNLRWTPRLIIVDSTQQHCRGIDPFSLVWTGRTEDLRNGSIMMFNTLLRPLRLGAAYSPFRRPPVRTFTIISTRFAKALPPRPKPPPESEIEESYVKGSGPGGQKIVQAPEPQEPSFSISTPHGSLLVIYQQRADLSPFITEQDKFRSAAQAYPYRNRRQVPSHPFSRPEPKARPGTPRSTGRRIPQR